MDRPHEEDYIVRIKLNISIIFYLCYINAPSAFAEAPRKGFEQLFFVFHQLLFQLLASRNGSFNFFRIEF